MADIRKEALDAAEKFKNRVKFAELRKFALDAVAPHLEACHLCGAPASGTCDVCNQPMCEEHSHHDSGYDEGMPNGPGEVTFCDDCVGDDPYKGPCKSTKDGMTCARSTEHPGFHRTLDGRLKWRDEEADQAGITASYQDELESEYLNQHAAATAKNAAPPDPRMPSGEEDPEQEANDAAVPPESEKEVERTEPATKAPHLPPPPVNVEPLPAEIAPPLDVPAVEPMEEEQSSGEIEARTKVEAAVTEPETIEAVMEFLKEQDLLDAHGLEIKEGVWGWSEASHFATVSTGHTEYVVAPSDDEATAFAEALVRQQLEDEPDNFTQSWLEGYINIDRLRDSLHSDVEEMVRESPESYGWKPGEDSDGNELVRYNAEGEEDEEGEYDSDGDKIDEDEESGPSDEWVENQVERQLKDPMEYLRDIYGDETMKHAMQIAGINIPEAASDAVAADGAGHFLSSYDGNLHDLPNGGVWYRTQ